MFSSFHAYDDEGYFLITLRDYVSGHPLFTQALPIYGPFYYEVIGGVFKLLGAQPTNDSGRLLTVVVWLITSLGGGLVTYRLTRSVLLSVAAQLVLFRALDALTNEPVQPAGLLALLLVVIAGAAAFRTDRPRLTATVIGGAVGALCLVKINVGVFAALAVAVAWVAGVHPPWRRLGLLLMTAVIAVVPWLVTRSLIGQAWVVEFAVLASLSAAAVGVAVLAAAPPRVPPATGWLVGGGAVVVVVTVAIALAGGTRFADMWNGVVVLAVQFPQQIYTFPLMINLTPDVWAFLGFGSALLLATRRIRISPHRAGLIRVGLAMYTWLAVLLLPTTLFVLALPVTWVATRGPSDAADDPSNHYARLFLPLLAVTESLQAFPVAGTQLSLAALTFVPLAAVMFNDGLTQLRSMPLARASAPSMLAAIIAATAFFALLATADFANGAPLGLPGAESVRLPAKQGTNLRGLVAAIDRQCKSFIAIPGMPSLYVWTEQDQPVELSSEVWWLVLDSAKQQSLVDQLQSRPDLCVVKNQKDLDFWAEGRAVPQRPLVEFIDHNFSDAGTYGDYQLLVRSAAPT